MKATGIVRRIDDLGRVVIPKEIRRTLRIKEGTPLEIFTDREGQIILKKYSPIGELSIFAKEYAEALAQTTGLVACITDHDQVVAAAGPGNKEFAGKKSVRNWKVRSETGKASVQMEMRKENPCGVRPGREFVFSGCTADHMCGRCHWSSDSYGKKRKRCDGKFGTSSCTDGSRISGTSDGAVN